MAGAQWATENIFNVVTAIIGIGGLFFTAFTIQKDTKERKLSNLLQLTANHRDVWDDYLTEPKLWRVTNSSVDLREGPVQPDEKVFVTRVILHLSSAYEALKCELLVSQNGLKRDVAQFFSLPIPRAVWEETKLVQNIDFVDFVEECRRETSRIRKAQN